jgi:general secretion pathway protein M
MSEAHPIAGRLAALALLAGAIAAVAVFGVLPMVERIRAADEALDFDRQLILRLSAASVNPGSYDTRLAALRSRIDQSDLYLRAETEPLAAVALQEQVKSAVGQYGGELRSVQSLPSQDADGLTRIGLRVGMTGELEAVLRVLHQLESDEPLVFAENLQINEAGRRRRRSQETEQENAQLSVRFDIFGYLPPAVDQ